MPTRRRVEKIARVRAARQPDLHVVVDEVCHPHNISAVLRTCDAAGVGMVHLVGDSGVVEGPSAISRGAEKWLETERHDNIAACYARLHRDGYRVLCASTGPEAVDYRLADLTQRIAIVVGNEHHGVSHSAAFMADQLIHVPMLGMAESLNVSVAAGVILFEALRQRQPPGSDTEKESSP